MQWTAIVNIQFEREDWFYDLHVPGAEHYLAEGVYHHNTGKTWGCLQYADALLWKYPGAQGVLLRKTYASLIGSAYQSYRRIIGDDSPIKAFGGEMPRWFDYPNGSRLWIVGLDKPGKVLSSERDFFCVNQAEELTLEEWEIVTTRATGRGAVMPYTRVFGDCNPGPPNHWIKAREIEGKLKLLESRHEHNPVLYDEGGSLTPQGERSLAVLDSLTGVRHARLRMGKWVAAEGQVYEEWDPDLHLIDAMPAGWQKWRKVRGVDFGHRNPFVCGWFAIDGDGRMYLYRQIYETGLLVSDAAKEINRLSRGEFIEATVCDHDLEDRMTLQRAGIATIPAYKAVIPGIENLQARLRKAKDGKPRFYILRSSLVKLDRSLHEARKPVQTQDEFEVHVWHKGPDGRPIKEEPVKDNDHGLDMSRYCAAHVDHLASVPMGSPSAGGTRESLERHAAGRLPVPGRGGR